MDPTLRNVFLATILGTLLIVAPIAFIQYIVWMRAGLSVTL